MSNLPPLAAELVDDLLLGNHILYKYGVVDAFGHISVRHDADPQKYVMSRHFGARARHGRRPADLRSR